MDFQTNGGEPGRVRMSAADAAAAAEESFLRQVQDHLIASGQVWDLCRRTSVTVPNELRPTHRVNRLSAVRRTRFEYIRRWRWLADCPQGANVLFDLRRYTWWGRLRGRVLVEVRSLARLERLWKIAGKEPVPAAWEMAKPIAIEAASVAKLEFQHALATARLALDQSNSSEAAKWLRRARKVPSARSSSASVKPCASWNRICIR